MVAAEVFPQDSAMLVRSHSVIDLVWSRLAEEAKKNNQRTIARSRKLDYCARLGNSRVAKRQAKVADLAKRKRSIVNADIVESNNEISTKEKILLIVSRSLNDRLSVSGHLYGQLIRECKARADTGEEEKREDVEIYEKGFHDNDDQSSCDTLSTEDTRRDARERRQDAHRVIKHVTTTLLEIRPGLGATPRLTWLTATAVEALVFGELYDLVFGEIKKETRDKDMILMHKISEFEINHYLKRRQQRENTSLPSSASAKVKVNTLKYPITGEDISVGALEALLSIPEAHAPTDKLAYCVQFLETISAHFSKIVAKGGESDNKEGTSNDTAIDKIGDVKKETDVVIKRKRKKSSAEVMGADSLLGIVCEHIIVAKVPRLNAEISFLEEFARGEQLLLGKEGYSLATLQASLHFLNASNDFYKDIFNTED